MITIVTILWYIGSLKLLSLTTATMIIAGERHKLLHYHPSSESTAVSMGLDSLIEPYDAKAMTYHP